MLRAMRGLWVLSAACVAGAAAPPPSRAQGVTTAAVQGFVRTSDGIDADGARVAARNTATGFVVEVEVRNGRFLIQGLEVGGPYEVTAGRIGLRAERRVVGMLSLGEPLMLDLVLAPMPIQLDTLVVVAADRFPRSTIHGGTAAMFSDSVVHRLPTLDRNVYDFVRLVPQISTRVGLGAGGMSAGGVGLRFNHFLTNGVPERSLSGSQPPEFAGGKSLPFEAVSEYQILVAPFDVRYGDFAGAAVNTVTRSGTNRLQGTAFVQGRSDALARSADALLPYERRLYGLSLGGPIRRDRAHFFVAAELQRLTAPMSGPYVEQPPGAVPPVPVAPADLARLDTIMRSYGLEAGTGGAVQNRNPLRNLFARVDVALPGSSRAAVWYSDADTESLVFARDVSGGTFPLSSASSTTAFGIRTVAAQVHTALARGGGGHNELFVSGRWTRFGADPSARQPIVSVGVPGATGGTVSLVTGPPGQAHGADAPTRGIDLRDNLTLPVGASHVLSLGIEAEWFRLEPGGPANAWGSWSFQSLDSLAAGLPDRYDVTLDLGSAGAALTGAQFAAYVGDRWQAHDDVSFTIGLRADVLTVGERPRYNARIDSIFGRRTDQWPLPLTHLSPRLGFTWDIGGNGRDQVRGGAGLFTGRPPLAWLHTPLRTYGFGIGSLRCGTTGVVQGPPPAFDPDPATPPVACGNGAGAAVGDVELVDEALSMARSMRFVLAWERRLGGGVLGTVEGMITRGLSDYVFANPNLVGPQSVGPSGRVLYGAIDAAGRATPALRDVVHSAVIDLRSTSGNHAEHLSLRLEKRFADGAAALASYTWSRVRDVQTPTRVNLRGAINWSSRAVSGQHEDLGREISANDIPHRVVLAGAWRAPWPRWTTELSFLYVGESGTPFTYLAWGGQLGDLNADGSNANDPVYVPRDALDASEIVFSGVSSQPGADNSPAAAQARALAQAEAFERLVASTPCLDRRRGEILERNGCRSPWTHTTVMSVRQQVPLAGRALEVQLDVFNVLNLLDSDWGRWREASASLLEHVGQTPGPGGTSLPVFRFDAAAPRWLTNPLQSAFQLQLGLRYRF
jgi:hypothetical protein